MEDADQFNETADTSSLPSWLYTHEKKGVRWKKYSGEMNVKYYIEKSLECSDKIFFGEKSCNFFKALKYLK